MNYTQEKVIKGEIEKLTEAELLGIIISNEGAATEILERFGSFKGMCNQPLEKLIQFKGLGDAKAIQIAACFEIACRLVIQVREEEGK